MLEDVWTLILGAGTEGAVGLHSPGEVVGTTSGKWTLGDEAAAAVVETLGERALAAAATAAAFLLERVGQMEEASGGMPGGAGGGLPDVMLL